MARVYIKQRSLHLGKYLGVRKHLLIIKSSIEDTQSVFYLPNQGEEPILIHCKR